MHACVQLWLTLFTEHTSGQCLAPYRQDISRVGQDRISTLYVTIYLVISLPNIPYIYRFCHIHRFCYIYRFCQSRHKPMQLNLQQSTSGTKTKPMQSRKWCSGGAVVVQWWCSGGAVVVQWCSGTVVQWWCCGAVVVQWCSGGAVKEVVRTCSSMLKLNLTLINAQRKKRC